MKYLVIATILVLGLASFALSVNNCPRVKCSTTAPSTKTGECARVVTENNSTMASLSRCDEGYICPKASMILGSNNFTLFMNVTANCEMYKSDLSTDSIKVDGEKCTSSSECSSNSCTSSKCVGKDVDATCASHAECKKGLACISLKCVAQKKTDEGCTTEFDCVNDHGCRNSKCMKYGSLADSTELNASENKALCKNNWIRIDGTKRICDRATLKADQCKNEADNDCNYTLSNGANYVGSSCLCKYDTDRTRMCPDLRMGSVDTTSDHTLRRFKSGVTWDTQIETCVSEVLSGKREWYVKAWESTYEAFYGALDWITGLFGSSSSSLSLSYLMISLFAVAMN